ncbi:glycoside hydrolase family 18 protein [Lactarius sanguifluus]|nr:glycoside hydrolase family 18 protein [Lactarius sanguifluus]
MAYYPGWVAEDFPPESIDFSRFDWIDFAFAEPDENFTLAQGESDTLLRLCWRVGWEQVGGVTAEYFSWAVQNDSSRHTFVGNIVDVYSKYNLDGIDIDWEYPGTKGSPQNYVDQSDTANLLEFFKLLRAELPPTARITAAVQTTPFTGANGQPMDDVRAFVGLLDWVLLMNYDVWGASPNPGPNAPLSNACHNSSQPAASAEAAVNAWAAAGFPSNKLVLGVPSYGYISDSKRTATQHTLLSPDEGADNGQVQFRELVRQSVLCEDPGGPGVYVGCGGFTREWDACSSTPFQVVTYDDPQSLGLKAAFAKQHGLLGVNLFDVHGDTDRWELVDSLRQGPWIVIHIVVL